MKWVANSLAKFIQINSYCAFLVLLLSVSGFLYFSYSLGMLFVANINFIHMHGWLAIQEGAWLQMLEILGYATISLCFYIIFKAAEKVLVENFLCTKN